MSKVINLNGYVENGQFSGGATVTPGSPGTLSFTAGGLYVGQVGTLVAQTIDGSIVSFVSASGFIPGIFTAVSSSSTCGSIVALK
jgi:hypothetical protein